MSSESNAATRVGYDAFIERLRPAKTAGGGGRPGPSTLATARRAYASVRDLSRLLPIGSRSFCPLN